MRRFVTPSILVATILAAPSGALAKGGYVRRPEPVPISRAGVPTPQSSPSDSSGGCGRGRYRDPGTQKCRGMSVTDAAGAPERCCPFFSRTMKQASFMSSIVHGGGKRRLFIRATARHARVSLRSERTLATG